jgi:hypothetical protein
MLPFFHAIDASLDDAGHIQRKGSRHFLGNLVIFEDELPIGPKKTIVDTLFALELKEPLQLNLTQEPFGDEDPSQRLIDPFLFDERGKKLFLVDMPGTNQVLP